ncbi:hypothetical protein Mgra_00007608 [Meloidogyne graminicola]|uniref:Glucuronosyltransferase n=1 Tax=Meloidogyne graminicola TaxID=189291 RepID=A0A8S9ZIC3_9BILA|nr:hypothetical protein Mgra_00007608 [Meloidogyne graminicola]
MYFIQILFLFIFENVFGYKILVFSPTISASHMLLDGRVADTLAKGGHDVTLLEVEFKLPLGSLNTTKYAKVKHIKGSFTSSIDDKILQEINNMLFQSINPFFILNVFLPYVKEANRKCESKIKNKI